MAFKDWGRLKPGGTANEAVAKIHEATAWLLKRTTCESGEGRRRAVNRLIRLCPLMTPEQRVLFGELLWAATGADGLPECCGLAASSLLHLPAPANVDVASLVREHILSLPTKGSVQQDGGRTTISVAVGRWPPTSEASMASRPVVQLAGGGFGTIEWAAEEAKQLYLAARDRWANDKPAFGFERTKLQLFGPVNSVLRTWAELGRFLAYAILPQMEWADEEAWQEILAWLEEARSFDVSPSMALPYILLHRPAEADRIARSIAEDLDCSDSGRVAAAAGAIRHWIHLAAIRRTPDPPSALLTSLIGRAVFRRKVGVNACLWHLSCLITEMPGAVAPSQTALLGACLSPWHGATTLDVPEEGSGDFPEAERPEVQVHVAYLAAALRKWHAKQTPVTPESPGIAKWQKWCEADPLPEVRRAFNSWSELTL